MATRCQILLVFFWMAWRGTNGTPHSPIVEHKASDKPRGWELTQGASHPSPKERLGSDSRPDRTTLKSRTQMRPSLLKMDGNPLEIGPLVKLSDMGREGQCLGWVLEFSLTLKDDNTSPERTLGQKDLLLCTSANGFKVRRTPNWW